MSGATRTRVGSLNALVRRWRDIIYIAILAVVDPRMTDEVLGYAKCEILRNRGMLRDESPNAQRERPTGKDGGE